MQVHTSSSKLREIGLLRSPVCGWIVAAFVMLGVASAQAQETLDATADYLLARDRAKADLADDRLQALEEAALRSADKELAALALYDVIGRIARAGDPAEASRRFVAAGGVVKGMLLLPASAPIEVDASPVDASFHLGAFTEVDAKTPVTLSFGVEVKRLERVAFRLASTGPLTLFVDGERVFRTTETSRSRRLLADTHTVQLTLSAGMHEVELGVEAGTNQRLVRVRVESADHTRRAKFALQRAVASPSVPQAGALDVGKTSPLSEMALKVALDPRATTESCLKAGLVLEASTKMTKAGRPSAITRTYERAIKVAKRTAPLDETTATSAALAGLRLAALTADDTTAADAALREAERWAAAAAAAPSLKAQVDLAIGAFLSREGRDQEAASRWQAVAKHPSASARDRLAAHGSLRGEGRGRLAHDRAVFELAEKTNAVEARLKAAWVAEDRGDYRRARKELEWVAKRQPTHPDWLYFLHSQAEVDPKLVKEFLEVAKLRLKIAPHLHGLAHDLVLALDGAGHSAEALAVATRRTEMFPQTAAAWRSLALLHHWRGALDAAKAAAARAKRLRPQDASIRRLLRVLSRSETPLVPMTPVDPVVFESIAPLGGAAEVGAEFLRVSVGARFFENGLGTIEREELVRIVDATRAKDENVRRYFYAEGREAFEVLVANHYRADGRLLPPAAIDEEDHSRSDGVYSDERAVRVTFEPLRDGDLLHVIIREDLIGKSNLFGDFFGLIEPIGRRLPTHEWNARLRAPVTRPLSVGGRGAPPPVSTVVGQEKTLVFQRKKIERVKSEPFAPPYFDIAPYLSVSTYADWEALGAWYATLINPQLVLTDDIRAKALSLAAPHATEEAKVRSIYNWVVQNTRYVGIELGVHGWKPYSVEEIWRRRFGDCKDKASLLITMLAAVDVGAQIVLVRTADLGDIKESPPSMWAFNHAIAYIPSLDLYLDGTAEHSGVRELPAADQGASVLRVTPRISASLLSRTKAVSKATIPLATAAKSENASDYVLQLDTFGNVEFRGRETFTGTRAAPRRRQLADADRRREKLEAELSNVAPGAQVRAVSDVQTSLGDDVVSYRFDGRIPRFARPSPGGFILPLSLYPHQLAKRYADRTSRQLPLWFSAPWSTTNRISFVLPSTAREWALPTGVSIRSKHLDFSQTFHETSNGFRVEETTTLKSRQVPISDYAAFRDAALRADRAMQRTWLIEFEGEDEP